MAKPIKDQLTKQNLGKWFFSFLMLLVCCCVYSQQTTTWTAVNLNTWESFSSDGLVRVECRVTGGVLISGNETMGCTSDATYGDPTPDVFGSPSLEISVAPLLTGTLQFHFFDAASGNPVYLTNPFVNVDKVGTFGILPFPLLNGTNTGVFTLTNGTWTNTSRNGPIFESTNTQFQIDANALLSSNGGECGNGVDQGTGGGTMQLDSPVQSIEMDVSISGSLISFNENVEFVLSNLIIAEPFVEVTKTVTENYSVPVSAGDSVDYSIRVENTGNVEVVNIELTDTFTDANGNTLTLSNGPTFISSTMGSAEGTLAANEIATYSASYTLTVNEVDAGGVINQVTAVGDSPYGPDDTSDISDDGIDTDGNLLDDLTESYFPVPLDDVATVEEDAIVDILVADNDDFGGNGPNTGSIILVSTPSNGTVALNTNGSPNNPLDDYFTYTPNTDYFGTDTFVYGIIDAKGHTQYATVTITIYSCPDAGTDSTLNICQGDVFTNADLFAQLGGSPDSGGNWTDNGDGTNTYTVLATAPCTTDDSSTVTVIEQAPPNAGTDGTLSICQGDTFDNNDLFSKLGGSPDPGGNWIDNGDGTHTYTVTATAPCTTDDSSTVTVIEQAQPNAGTDGTLNICQGDTFTNADLFAELGGSPDSGGTWTDNGDGTHTYIVTATAPCTVDDTSLVTVVEQAPPNAGNDGTLNICQGDNFTNADLFAQLGGSSNPGGSWTDNGDGTHTYTVIATAPCSVDDSSTVTVIEQTPPNAGTDGTLTICQGDVFTNADLFAQLGGSPDSGGTWTDNGDGTHTYSVLATAPCTVDDTSLVTVVEQAPPNAGTDGTLNICQGDSFTNADLFAQLGGSPDSGGTWTDNGDGTHTYTVTAAAPCSVDDSSTVTVIEQAPPNAGTDGTLTICQGDTFDNNDLFSQLGGSPDPGGSWADNGDGTHTYTVTATAPCTVDDTSLVTVVEQATPNAGNDGTLNICQGDNFTNADLFAQLGGSPDSGGTWTDNGDGTHTYSVLATAPCTVDDTSLVTVVEQAPPNAGTDGTLNICQGDSFTNADLFAQLGGSPDSGGTWTDNGDGTHTYTVLATAPCSVDDSSTVTVTEQTTPSAGNDGTLNICQGDSFTNADLFAQLGGSPDSGGTWTDNGDGTHTYTVTATAPCTVDDTSLVTVVEQGPPNAGNDGTLNICQGDTFTNADLFAELGGSPDTGGSWADNGDGTHTYTVTATAPCTVDDSSTVTVIENQTDSNNNGIADCSETIPVQLIIDIDSITTDNIVNEQEALGTISVTGTVSGDFNQGDIATLSINNTNFTGPLDNNGNFNIPVSGNDLFLDSDRSVLGTVTTINSNANTGSASVQHPYTVDIEAPLVESFSTTETYPILLGSGSPNEILTIVVNIGNSGDTVIYDINTDIDGIWAIDTATEVPQIGNFPVLNPVVILSITATDIAGNTGMGEVVIIFKNEPLNADSDNDGLPDEQEIQIGTDPNIPDTDGDGVMDGQEVSDGTDPLDPCDSLGGTPPIGSRCEIYVELDIVQPGDPMNGNFEIINIERFPNNTVQIYNRWGIKVWETKGYQNNINAFNGISQGRTTIMQNEELPSGVYYYDIQYEARGEQKLLTGYLYVIR